MAKEVTIFDSDINFLVELFSSGGVPWIGPTTGFQVLMFRMIKSWKEQLEEKTKQQIEDLRKKHDENTRKTIDTYMQQVTRLAENNDKLEETIKFLHHPLYFGREVGKQLYVLLKKKARVTTGASLIQYSKDGLAKKGFSKNTLTKLDGILGKFNLRWSL